MLKYGERFYLIKNFISVSQRKIAKDNLGKEYSNIFFLMQEKFFLFNRCETLTLCRYVALVEKIYLVTISHSSTAQAVLSVCRKTPICKQIGVKFMPNYAFAQKSRSITAKNEKNMCFLQLWIAYFLRFIAANLSLTQFVT